MPRLLLGIDIGTTATKGILLEPGSGIIAQGEAPSALLSPRSGWAEEDPGQWWENLAAVSRICLEEIGAEPEEIAAIGVSGMVPTLILLDADGRPLRPSIQQNDARSYLEIDRFLERVTNEEVLDRTGSSVTQQSIGPKLLWLRRNEPDVLKQAAHLMGSYDYIVYKLTGESSCERNWALESGLFDLHREAWDPIIMELSTIEECLLGRVHWTSEVVGKVTREAAELTGLTQGTPVVAGSADHIASAFSAGLKSPGDLLVKLGGAGDIMYSLDEPVVDARLFLDYHVIPGKYVINGCMAASGSIIKWFQQQFAAELDYRALDEMAAGLSPGSDGLVLLPYFLGEKTPINDPLARGVIFGLDLSHTRAHLYRAVLEGISYGFLHHLDVLAERGLEVSKARVTNGGARSRLWKQITSDVLGLPLDQVADHPGSSLGAAFVAGMGVGVFDDWSQIERFITISETVEPDWAAHEHYRRFFGIYRDLYRDLKDKFPLLLEVSGKKNESDS